MEMFIGLCIILTLMLLACFMIDNADDMKDKY